MAGKKFLEVELPIIKQKVELLASSEKDLIGRTVKIDLTRKLRGRSLEAIFKIKEEQGKLKIVLTRLHIFGYFIRRVVRKSTNYVEDSFSSEAGNAVLRIKPFMVTRKKVSRAVRKALREKAKELIEKEVKNKKYEDFFSELLSGKLQRALSLKLKKVYPLAFFDIRDVYVEKEEELVKKEKVK